MERPPIPPRRPTAPGIRSKESSPGARPAEQPSAGVPPVARLSEKPGTRKLGEESATGSGGAPAHAAPSDPASSTRRFVKSTGAHSAVRGREASGTGKAATPTPPTEAPAPKRHAERPAGTEARLPPRSEAAGAPPTIGHSLGTKFALGTAASVTIASLIFTLLVYKSTTEELNREINDSGKKIVQILSCIGSNVWREMGKKQEQYSIITKLMTVTKELKESVQEVEKIAKKLEGQQELKDASAEARKKLEKYLTIPEDVRNAFARAIGEDPFATEKIDHSAIVALDILEPTADPTKMDKLVGTSTVGYTLPKGVELVKDRRRGISITESTYHGTRVRRFQKELEGGAIVQLDMSAKEIDEARKRLTLPLVLASIMVILIGTGIGLILARSVTRPLKTLVNDMDIVSKGNLDHQTIPHSQDEIGLLARTFNRMTKGLKIAHQAELEAKALEHELNIATEIQQNLLPKRLPKIQGFDIFATYRPSKEVGGDYFDFIQIDDDNMGIVVADVSGEGVPGSMVMTMARSLIRMEAERNLSTADTLIKVNRILARDIRRGMFVTCLYMILNLRNKTLLVSSAGHNPLVLWRQATKKHELVNPSGIALGFDKGPLFERNIKQQLVELAPGDRFLAYTDGVVECMSPANMQFGETALYALIDRLAEKESSFLINSIAEALEAHQGNAPQHDDITMVTVRLLPG